MNKNCKKVLARLSGVQHNYILNNFNDTGANSDFYIKNAGSESDKSTNQKLCF